MILVAYRDLVILKMLCESHAELYIMGTIRVKILHHWLVVVFVLFLAIPELGTRHFSCVAASSEKDCQVE